MPRKLGRIKLQLVFLTALSCFAGRFPSAAPNVHGKKRLVGVPDCIRMTRLADSAHDLGGSARGRVAQFSPDGSKFLVTLRKGNLEQNTDDYSLLLFKTSQALDSPQPEVLLTLASSSNRAAFSTVKWLDNETVAFLGERPNSLPQVYVLNTTTKRLQRLTEHPTPVISYDITSDGENLVFEADPPGRKTKNMQRIERSGIVVATQQLAEILAGDSWSFQPTILEGEQLFVKHKGESARQIPVHDVLMPSLPPPSISPDGRDAIITVFLREPPRPWERYQDPLLHERITAKRMIGASSNVPGHMLLETKSGNLSPLLDAPPALSSSQSNGLVWAPDGHSLVLSGTFLPLDVTDPVELDTRSKNSYVIELSLPHREITKITDRALRVARWDRASDLLMLESGEGRKKPELVGYQKGGSGWEEVSIKPENVSGDVPIEVTVDEDINTPPRILVSDLKRKRHSLLLDLNPQFAQLRFGRAEAVSWNATDGHEVLGGLYLPPDYVPGRKYPLVIQTHGFDPSRFMIDGPWGAGAFSAQPLASRGFVVLQVGGSKEHEKDRIYTSTRQEAPREITAYEGAIDYLAGRGIIDPSRVGIIGFSRTVYTVKYALTHSKYRFAAATAADGIDAGYFSYMDFPNKDYENLNGGPPFGETLQLWLKNAPGFNLDKVRTPLRIEAYSPFTVVGAWEWFSGLTYLRKPVEFIYLPHGTHILIRPSDRMTSQQGNVDWFSFWLLGEEDTDATKREQYARWHQLASLQLQAEKGVTQAARPR